MTDSNPLQATKSADGTPAVVREARLVYDRKQKHHFWHLVVEDGVVPVPVVGGITAAIDLGEIHPVAITDGKEVCIMSCRELRSVGRQTSKEQQHLRDEQLIASDTAIRVIKLTEGVGKPLCVVGPTVVLDGDG